MTMRFDEKLVLSRWMLSRFGTKDLGYLKKILSDDSNIGFNEENISRFYEKIIEIPETKRKIDDETLLAYDENIVRWWKKITNKRNASGNTLYPLYFQYLSLLFTEYYLDRYFSSKEALLNELNEYCSKFNAEMEIPQRELVEEFVLSDLNKLAIWIATGGGKTLIMHINIEQFKFYRNKHEKCKDFNRIILLTPNEGLSRQHEKEFAESSMSAELFNPDGQTSFFSSEIDIIDIHKLKEKKGEKTVAIESFETNNLVLVDEGHRGASGDEWLNKRNQICENGFSFEYSATFGQAIKAASKGKQKILTQLYTKCILFDYSYRYFHEDGYGKDHAILNLQEERLSEQRQLYLTACLLGFYEQKIYFKNNKKDLANYLLENPLWIFVGGSVTGNRASKELTDVQQIIFFLSEFLANKSGESVSNIKKLMLRKDDLRTSDQKPVFSNMFTYLIKQYGEGTSSELFSDVLKIVFNSEIKGILHVVQLKGSSGEIGLRVGGNEFFGVINVGDPSSLVKKCEKEMTENNVVVTEQSFSSSLFHKINTKDSNVNLLVGAKKFSEGWSSWRVSSMGLMNVGKSEGSEIIQLFGRGIRLKGYDFSLKRSAYVDKENLEHPEGVALLETLNVFGVKSSYMEEFEQYLKEEGVDKKETETVTLPVITQDFPDDLHIVKPDDDMPSFKKNERPVLSTPPKEFSGKVIVDWYPKIQSKRSKTSKVTSSATKPNEGKLKEKHLAFIDFDSIYFELEQFKNEKARYNIQINRTTLKDIISKTDWYILYIPEYSLEVKDFERIKIWQEIATTLLKKYFERFYAYKKNEYEKPFLKYYKLDKTDPNFIKEYKAVIDKSKTDWITKVREFAAILQSSDEPNTVQYPMEFSNLKLFNFDKHLYEPLVKLNNDEIIKISPVSMNDGEHDFVEDLNKYCSSNTEFFKDKELYLLRNQSKSGIGFFLEGNFYPDFILWLKDKDKQYVNFVDPKGLRNIKGFSDPKISFHEKIKEIEEQLGSKDIVLNSFIISNTSHSDIKWWGDGDESEKEFANNHVLFQDDEGYMGSLFEMINC